VPFDSGSVGPFEYGAAGHLGSVVANDRRRLAAGGCEDVEFSNDARATDRGVDDEHSIAWASSIGRVVGLRACAGPATWRKGTKGPLKARFAAVRVRGPMGRLSGSATRACSICPGEEVWLVGERRASGEQKYYLANLPAEAGLKRPPGQSRGVGFASRRIRSSRKSSGSTTSRADHGEARIAMR